MKTLHQAFDARRNNFDLVRLGLALVVAVAHGIVMRTGTQPYWGRSTLGDFALDGFFVLSGFLVTRSWLQLGSPWRYTWHRLLRIMPAFWVCLLVLAFVVAPLAAVLEDRPLAGVFAGPDSALRFVAENAGLMIFQYNIGEVFGSNPTPLVVDGSLWTLVLEAFCYALLGGLGLLGILARRRWILLALVSVLWVMQIGQEAGVDVLIGDDTLRLVLMFLLGATALLFADRVPMSAGLAIGASAVFLASVAFLENYRLVGAAPLTYVLLWLSAALPWRLRLRTDLSYGIYIYHWPVQQLLMLTVLASLPTVWFVVLSLAVVAAPAALSWRFVEKPSLGRKHAAFPAWLREPSQREQRSATHSTV